MNQELVSAQIDVVCVVNAAVLGVILPHRASRLDAFVCGEVSVVGLGCSDGGILAEGSAGAPNCLQRAFLFVQGQKFPGSPEGLGKSPRSRGLRNRRFGPAAKSRLAARARRSPGLRAAAG